MIRQPYYNLHQIVTGQYTDGGEFVYEDGSDYVGLYHITPNQQVFSGTRPEPGTQPLFVKRLEQTTETIIYNKLKETQYPNYITPTLITPIPNTDDYTKGYIQRYFIQKRNSPQNTIIEIDGKQYNTINTTNKPGINGMIWNRCLIDWKISKIPKNDAEYINQLSIYKNESKFPYLNAYLTNKTEFYR